MKINNLTKYYGKFKALDGLSLTLEDKEVYGFIGPNGAGKTTTLNILMQLTDYSGGSIEFAGKTLNKGDYSYKRDIAFMPDVPQFPPYLTGREVLKLTGDFCGYEKRDVNDKIRALRETCGLSHIDKKVGAYSRGMVQRLALANALIQEPRLLIMDEPTSALDPVGRRAFLNIIKNLSSNITVLYSTHILSEAEDICDRIGLVESGRMRLEGPMASLLKNTSRPAYTIEGPDINAIHSSLKNQSFVENITILNDHIDILTTAQSGRKALFKHIYEHNLDIDGIYKKRPTLETLFVEVLNDQSV